MLEDKPNEAVRLSARPLNEEAVTESEPLSVLNSEMWSVKAEEKPMEPDIDFAKPLVSRPMRPMVPARDFNRATCSPSPEEEPRDAVSVFVIPLVCVARSDNELDSVLKSDR